MHLVAENVLEHLRLGVKQRIEEDVLSLGVLPLVDDAHDRLARELVGAEVREVRCETRGEEGVALRHAGRLEEPGDEEGAVGAGGEGDGIEDDSTGDAFLRSRTMVNHL